MDHSEVKHLPKVDHTPAELDDASKLLLEAAAKLEVPGGWGQCGPGAVRGRDCALTAIPWRDGKREAERRLRDSVGGSIFDWNDAPGRTAEEVVSKMRTVALGL